MHQNGHFGASAELLRRFKSDRIDWTIPTEIRKFSSVAGTFTDESDESAVLSHILARIIVIR